MGIHIHRYLLFSWPRLAALSAALFFLRATQLNAAEQVIDITVPTSAEPESAAGLILQPNGGKRAAHAEIMRAAPGQVIVALGYDDEKVPSGSSVVALIRGRDGSLAFSPVIALPSKGQAPGGDPPPCPAEPAGPELAEALTAIEKLVTIRSQMLENARARFANSLTPELIKRLRRIEDGFGLNSDGDINADMDSLDLVDRLSRILNALQSYKFHHPEPAPGRSQD